MCNICWNALVHSQSKRNTFNLTIILRKAVWASEVIVSASSKIMILSTPCHRWCHSKFGNNCMQKFSILLVIGCTEHVTLNPGSILISFLIFPIESYPFFILLSILLRTFSGISPWNWRSGLWDHHILRSILFASLSNVRAVLLLLFSRSMLLLCDKQVDRLA